MIVFYKKDCGVVHNRKENFGCGACSKFLPYSIESQVGGGFGIQASVMKSFYRKTIGVTLEYRRRWSVTFPDKQLVLGYREKSVVESILSKFSAW